MEDKYYKILEAAKLYYQLDYSQQEIANRLDISRPSVSRLLQQAKELGIVHIKIQDPRENLLELSNQIKENFKLKECIIGYVPTYEKQLIKEMLGEIAAEYIYKVLKDGDQVGITWGTTLYQVAQKLHPKSVRDVKVVQLNGGVSYSETETFASEILSSFSKAFHTIPYFLPLPAVVDQVVVKNTIVTDRHIKRVLEIGQQSNIAILTVGEPGRNSTLVKAGYFSKEDLEVLERNGAVGDICSRYFNIHGEICHRELDERTIGISLEDLRMKEHSILVAGGNEKVHGIFGALKGKYCNELITDQMTARSLLAML